MAPTWEVLAKVMYDANEDSEEEAGSEYGEEEMRIAEQLDVPIVVAKVSVVIFQQRLFELVGRLLLFSNWSCFLNCDIGGLCRAGFTMSRPGYSSIPYTAVVRKW